MAAQVTVFARFESESAGAVTACIPAPTPLVETFAGPLDWTQEATVEPGSCEDFFLPSRVFQVYDCY